MITLQRDLLSCFTILLFISGCSSELDENENHYAYLDTCFEDYYLNFSTDVEQELTKFEKHLIQEGHLKDASGKAYKQLLTELARDVYFEPPLEFDEFNDALLYKVPENLMHCATSIFGLDSSEIANTSYFKMQNEIRKDLNQDDSIAIGDVFNYNVIFLSETDFEDKFIRHSTLQLLYRWYFQSKNERDTPFS